MTPVPRRTPGQQLHAGFCSAVVAALACAVGAQASDRVAEVSVLLDPALDVGRNRPLVDVTVCNATGDECQIVQRVLLDTGATGLMLKPAVWSNWRTPLHRLHSPGGPWGFCARFEQIVVWSWLAWAHVGIAGLRTLEPIPIGLIVNAGVAPPDCDPTDVDAALPGDINGILGVAAPRSYCAGFPGGRCPIGWSQSAYYTLHSSSGYWQAAQPPPSVDLANPIAHFAYGYNDGIVLRMPALRRIAPGARALRGELHLGVAASLAALFPAAPLPEYPTLFDSHIAGTIRVGARSCEGYLGVDSGAAFNQLPHALTCAGRDCVTQPCRGFECGAATLTLGEIGSWQQLGGVLVPSVIARSLPLKLKIADADELGVDWGAHDGATHFVDGLVPTLGMPFLYGRTLAVGISGSAAPSGRMYPFGYLLIADNPLPPASGAGRDD
ncbi:hypothetical protein GALL_290520 [mine drainage metagenome]|uniref:Uncharacterized protein n=1 Tax=mine drainage metagenome TaxID=410659 RepID=A0A1J5RLN8_9ZZZZ